MASSTVLNSEPTKQDGGIPAADYHRIIESLRMEKTSKIIKSSRQPNTTIAC